MCCHCAVTTEVSLDSLARVTNGKCWKSREETTTSERGQAFILMTAADLNLENERLWLATLTHTTLYTISNAQPIDEPVAGLAIKARAINRQPMHNSIAVPIRNRR